MDEGELERFFGSLNAGLEEAAISTREELGRFFNELAPRWETAQTLERELDRVLAQKFNAFDYLRTDELGLSKVIADLLNPKGRHGQGPAFLQLLLCMLGFKIASDPKNSDVRTELSIKDGRRLDIAVQMDNNCLAIENKPYAGDQQNQVKDYLDWLQKKYRDFRLIYLSWNGEPPSNESVTLARLEKDYEETFRIMPYRNVQDSASEDGFDNFRTNFGLTDWLKECRKQCDVERLRWFLREAEVFCERQVGGNAMTTREVETVKEFVLKDSRNVATAAAVAAAWPQVSAKVRQDFLENIFYRMDEGYEGYSSFEGGWQYWDKRYQSWLRVYPSHWREFKNPEDSGWTRPQIALEAQDKGGNNWWIGIRMPAPMPRLSPAERSRRKQIEQRLRDASITTQPDNPWWPWGEWIDDRYRYWDALIPAMYAELQEEDGKTVGGEITNYFIEKFAEVAEFAVPILDEIEGT